MEKNELNALRVIVRTPHILNYLQRTDPEALKQVLLAIPYADRDENDNAVLFALVHNRKEVTNNG